jgi:hypothetical protein
MKLRELLPPTLVVAARLVRTRLIMSGLHDSAERAGRLETVTALRAQRPGLETGDGRARVLVFSLRGGWYPHTAWEAVIGHALRLRNASVHVFNCGGPMPICEVNFRHASPAVACRECALYPADMVASLSLERSWLADYVTGADRAEIESAVAALDPARFVTWSFDGRPVGQLVRNSVLWFLRKSAVDFGSDDARVYRDFLVAGALIARVAPRLIAQTRPDTIIELNGLFFAEQILNTFLPDGCRVATYEAGWRMNSLGFDWFSERGFADVNHAWELLAERPLTAEENARLDAWMRTRRGGDMQRDFYVRFDEPSGPDPIAALGLDPAKPTAVLFTNLVWDTAVFGRDLGFRTIADWLRQTVAWFGAHRERQLVIRIHPAEDLRPSQESNEKLSDVVRSVELPRNVVLVPSAATMSSYALIDAAAAVMVYTSTAGLEAALYRKPVLVGARVYYSDRGFTREVREASSLGALLEEAFAQRALLPAQVDYARRFAYLLLFRFLHDIPVVKQRARTLPLLDASEVPSLLPGAREDLDLLLAALVGGGSLTRLPYVAADRVARTEH